MRNALALLCLFLPALAQTPAGKWSSDTKWFDQDRYQRLELSTEGDQLTGTLGSSKLTGTFRAGTIDLAIKEGKD
jgi:hypothetical protein